MPSALPRAAAHPLALLAVACALSAGARADEPGLPASLDDARKMEQRDALPITDFYRTPANLAATRAGELLRAEPAHDYLLPAGASAVRILYHSLDATGRDVATSGVVLVPSGKAPAGGWPVIAWAHGTSGVARQCAPSAMKDVYYGEEGLNDFLAAGFAVVATDYHGLGTEGPHQYVNKTAQARDVIYSLPAARAAVPALGARWVVDGHSQGGLAAWGVAEIESRERDPDYLGAVSVAGATNVPMLLDAMQHSPVARFYADFMAFGVQARYGDFKPAELLSEQALRHYDEVTTRGCWYVGYASFRKDPDYAAFRAGWQSVESLKKFIAENSTGQQPVAGPMLVIAGEADQSVPFPAVLSAVHAACRNHLPISFRSYPGLDHDPVMIGSAKDQIAWIKDRFAGRPATLDCPTGS
jgi:hypothetical protein